MLTRSAKAIFVCSMIVMFLGCNSKSEPEATAIFTSKEEEFIELNKLLLAFPPFKHMDSKGGVRYAIGNESEIGAQHINIAASKLSALGVSNVKVFHSLFEEGTVYVEYEINRQGWLNQKVVYIIYSSSSEDIDKLSEVDGCSKYRTLRDFWYERVLYDDGDC